MDYEEVRFSFFRIRLSLLTQTVVIDLVTHSGV